MNNKPISTHNKQQTHFNLNFNNRINTHTKRQNRNAPNQCSDCNSDVDQNQRHGGSSTPEFLASFSSSRESFFFFFLRGGFGFLIRSVFVLGFVLGFLGLGSLRNESGRRTVGQQEGREREKKKKKEDGERKRMEEEGKHMELKTLRLEFHVDF